MVHTNLFGNYQKIQTLWVKKYWHFDKGYKIRQKQTKSFKIIYKKGVKIENKN